MNVMFTVGDLSRDEMVCIWGLDEEIRGLMVNMLYHKSINSFTATHFLSLQLEVHASLLDPNS